MFVQVDFLLRITCVMKSDMIWNLIQKISLCVSPHVCVLTGQLNGVLDSWNSPLRHWNSSCNTALNDRRLGCFAPWNPFNHHESPEDNSDNRSVSHDARAFHTDTSFAPNASLTCRGNCPANFKLSDTPAPVRWSDWFGLRVADHSYCLHAARRSDSNRCGVTTIPWPVVTGKTATLRLSLIRPGVHAFNQSSSSIAFDCS